MSIIKYSKKQAEAMKFLEWFIKDDVQKKWAELGGYTCSAKVLQSETFRKATPYNEAFYQTMFMVKDFWAVPEYAELLDAMNKRLHPFIVGNKGTARIPSTRVANDWDKTFKKYGRIEVSGRVTGRAVALPARSPARRRLASRPVRRPTTQEEQV